MIIYKDILAKLAEAGYNTTRLRRERLISEATITSIRHNKSISISTLNDICKLTGRPVEDLIEYRED